MVRAKGENQRVIQISAYIKILLTLLQGTRRAVEIEIMNRREIPNPKISQEY